MSSPVLMMRKMKLWLMHSSCVCQLSNTAIYILMDFILSCKAFVLFPLPCKCIVIAHFNCFPWPHHKNNHM